MITESQKLEELLVECVIPGLAELTAKQLPYGDKLQVFAGSRFCGNQYVLITLLKLQCLRHVSPLGAGVKLSVVQTDQVIIALPGDKSKMSIYEKIAISWRSAQTFPDSADRLRAGVGCSARGSSGRAP